MTGFVLGHLVGARLRMNVTLLGGIILILIGLKIFLEGIRQGRIKSNIKKYLDKEEKSIRDLIVKWGDSAKNKCFSFLEENGLTTMIQRKENRID